MHNGANLVWIKWFFLTCRKLRIEPNYRWVNCNQPQVLIGKLMILTLSYPITTHVTVHGNKFLMQLFFFFFFHGRMGLCYKNLRQIRKFTSWFLVTYFLGVNNNNLSWDLKKMSKLSSIFLNDNPPLKVMS